MVVLRVRCSIGSSTFVTLIRSLFLFNLLVLWVDLLVLDLLCSSVQRVLCHQIWSSIGWVHHLKSLLLHGSCRIRFFSIDLISFNSLLLLWGTERLIRMLILWSTICLDFLVHIGTIILLSICPLVIRITAKVDSLIITRVHKCRTLGISQVLHEMLFFLLKLKSLRMSLRVFGVLKHILCVI